MTNDDPDRRPRPRRSLNTFDWIVRVPIGFLWLGVLMIAVVPIFVSMTVLYWIVRAASSVSGRRRGGRTERTERQERVA